MNANIVFFRQHFSKTQKWIIIYHKADTMLDNASGRPEPPCQFDVVNTVKAGELAKL